MKSLKKLVLGGVTLAGLAMAAPHPAKADALTTAITATADAINLVLTIDPTYGIKWTYTQQKRADGPQSDPPPPPPQK